MPINPPLSLPHLVCRCSPKTVTAMTLATMTLPAMTLAAMTLAPTAQAQTIRDNVINQRCTKTATEEFAKLAKTPPAGFIPFTCGCVVQEINAQVPVDQAKASCKAQAIAKFGKP